MPSLAKLGPTVAQAALMYKRRFGISRVIEQRVVDMHHCVEH
jgi:hypothetical protein